MPRQTSLKAIEAKIKELEAIAEELKRVEKPGIKELKAVVAKFRLTPADITLALRRRTIRLNEKGPAKGTKLKPKYRNPAKKSETWAGRGLRPRWVVELMKQGKKLEDFAV
ncbi:MAG: H-NS histone family protein [Reyranella sp.]|nr:H-NS histone family protein [Reyranella sp.]